MQQARIFGIYMYVLFNWHVQDIFYNSRINSYANLIAKLTITQYEVFTIVHEGCMTLI